MTSVLVVRPSSLGDVVHALPVVADMRRHIQGVVVDWVAEEAFAPLVAMHPGVRRVIPVALRRWRHALLRRASWREFAAFRVAIRAERYDAVLDLQEQMKGALMARLAEGTRHGFARETIREPLSTLLHEVHHPVATDLHFEERCRRLAGAALGYALEGAPRYGLVAPPPPAGLMPPGRYAVCVHATTRRSKEWPLDHWRTLVRSLEAAGLSAVVPWGTPEERATAEAIARGHPHTIVPERHPLPAVAALLRSADVVVGVDTGLVHLAAALGTATVALFTGTDPSRAGVAIAGSHAVDLDGRDAVPSADHVMATIGQLFRSMPRC